MICDESDLLVLYGEEFCQTRFPKYLGDHIKDLDVKKTTAQLRLENHVLTPIVPKKFAAMACAHSMEET